MGTNLFCNMQEKKSGAMSIVLSKLLSPQNKGEFDNLVLMQQQDPSKESYVHVHKHTQICMCEYFYVNTEGEPATL